MDTESRREGPAAGQGYSVEAILAAEQERGKRRRWRLIGLLGIAVVVLVLAGTAYWQSRPPAPTALEAAYERCGFEEDLGAQLADEGRTLLLQTAGEENPLGMDYLEVLCAFIALDVPTRVTTQIAATRALDGRVSDSWDVYTATWTYHPNSGLNLMITID
ncbi:hypothetical protein [Pseudactinotalea sp. Z1732]|uniref:hypothetical protein n=1 Tax=Micrococcales TaxID=85006 RepID=UPI003C797F81